MKNKKNISKKLKILLSVLLISFIGLGITYAINTYDTGYKIFEANDNYGQNYEIIDDLPISYEGGNKCIKVSNLRNIGSTVAFLSTTKTKIEWINFKSWCNGSTDCNIEYLSRANLVLNGSFESTHATDKDIIYNWDGKKNWSIGSSINPKPDGSKYAYAWDSIGFYQDIDISSNSNGTDFKLDFYSGYNNCSSGSSGNQVQLKFLSSGKSILSSTSYNVTDQVHPDDNNDKTLDFGSLSILNKPSNAEYIRIHVVAGAGCDVKVDKLDLKIKIPSGKCNF